MIRGTVGRCPKKILLMLISRAPVTKSSSLAKLKFNSSLCGAYLFLPFKAVQQDKRYLLGLNIAFTISRSGFRPEMGIAVTVTLNI